MQVFGIAMKHLCGAMKFLAAIPISYPFKKKDGN
jgi:hypothetical protein